MAKKNKLWGGRFSKPTNKLVEEFTNSIHFDQKLKGYDVIGSLYHIEILRKARLLSPKEYLDLKKALEKIKNLILTDNFEIDPSFEDIHSYIQHLVEKEAPKAALKLHTCRSRNDQVVFDTKYYCSRNIRETMRCLEQLIKTLKNLANRNHAIVLPGYTHLQHAIPVKLWKYLFAYVHMLTRDNTRLLNADKNIILTLGAGALAGTFINSSKYNIAAKRHISEIWTTLEPTKNAIDVVSDRDFVVETLSTLSTLQMHLSRLAEDMILWATKEFDFIDIDDAFCTGSSLMPQKKNPDVLELVRGYTGRLYGNLVNVLTMMKGLPLSYNRDMQLDKEPLFDSFEIILKELKVLTELFKNVKFKKENIEKQLNDESLYATDLSDFLVRDKKYKVPFKEAHAIIGKLIQYKYKTGREIREMKDEELRKYHPLLTSKAVKKIIDPEYSVTSKKSVKRQRR